MSARTRRLSEDERGDKSALGQQKLRPLSATSPTHGEVNLCAHVKIRIDCEIFAITTLQAAMTVSLIRAWRLPCIDHISVSSYR